MDAEDMAGNVRIPGILAIFGNKMYCYWQVIEGCPFKFGLEVSQLW